MDRLNEIRARREALKISGENYNLVRPEYIVPVLADDGHGKRWAEVAAHSKEDIPWLLAQLEQMTVERDAAVADIAELLRNCTCEHRHDYCNECGEEECSGCYPGDCSTAKWRGTRKEAERAREANDE